MSTTTTLSYIIQVFLPLFKLISAGTKKCHTIYNFFFTELKYYYFLIKSRIYTAKKLSALRCVISSFDIGKCFTFCQYFFIHDANCEQRKNEKEWRNVNTRSRKLYYKFSCRYKRNYKKWSFCFLASSSSPGHNEKISFYLFIMFIYFS